MDENDGYRAVGGMVHLNTMVHIEHEFQWFYQITSTLKTD